MKGQHPTHVVADVLYLHDREGKSYTIIAARFGITRNAVAGIVERARKRGEIAPPRRRRGTRAERVAAAPRACDAPPPPVPEVAPPAPVEPEPAPMPVVADVVAEPIMGVGPAVTALRPYECRWPLGDPRDPGFRFCCARVSDEVAPLRTMRGRYCAAHVAASRSTAAPTKPREQRHG